MIWLENHQYYRNSIFKNCICFLEEKIGDHCTSPLITATYGIRANDAATVMADNRIKRLPLLKAGKLFAMVTARDLVDAFRKEGKLS